MRTWGTRFHFIVLAFGVNQRIRGQREFKIRLLQWWKLPHTESHLKIRQPSATELLCENIQRAYHVHCFRRKSPLQTSDRIPKMDLTRCDVNLGLGVLQVHNGIGSRRLVCKEVVEVIYKKSYF